MVFVCNDVITLAIFGNNQSVKVLSWDWVSWDNAQILREVIASMVHVEKQRTARWQRINKKLIKTWQGNIRTVYLNLFTDKSHYKQERFKKFCGEAVDCIGIDFEDG